MEEKDKIVFKGSHPDSLYRVPTGGLREDGKLMRVMRVLRWPVALFTVCLALAVFVYFLIPEASDMEVSMNSTRWTLPAGAHLQHPQATNTRGVDLPMPTDRNLAVTGITSTGSKTSEIDFYDTTEVQKNEKTVTDVNTKRKLPIPPVFPRNIVPEVQYGNENADAKNSRSLSALTGQHDKQPEDSTLKPHITHKPEKPLAIYFKDGTGLTTTSTETISDAETANDFTDFLEKVSRNFKDHNVNDYTIVEKEREKINGKHKPRNHGGHYRRPVNVDVHFTSGHSKIFGISIEDAEKLKPTTQSSVYHTRVSPTLPVWRNVDDATSKYPEGRNFGDDDAQPQCRSVQLPMCRGVLPYDLASMPSTTEGKDLTYLLPQFEYLMINNCSARLRQFACTLLEPECSAPLVKPRLPCYDLCTAVKDGCDALVTRELLAVLECHKYPRNNCFKARAPCYERELTCGDGTCVPRDRMCDGVNDCPDGEDEAKCIQCAKDEFNCPSGGCVLKRWLCDGYSDCNQGEDELDCPLNDKRKSEDRAEFGEESAGSAVAPSVRKLYQVNSMQLPKNTDYAIDESSRELLMTSDSSNPYRRNYTRKPSLARLTPYTKPIITDARMSRLAEAKRNASKVDVKAEPEIENTRTTLKSLRDEDNVPGINKKLDSAEDMNFFDDYMKGAKKSEAQEPAVAVQEPEGPIKNVKPNSPLPRKAEAIQYGRAPRPLPYSRTESPAVTEPQSVKKFERVIDGVELMRRKAEKQSKVAAMETTNDDDEFSSPETAGSKKTSEEIPRNETLISAHASPCPTGELRCVDGRCITLSQLCDGTIDCTDHADEDNCYT